MTLYMPPLAKKNPVDDRPTKYDTKRVFSNYDDKLGTSAKSHNQTTHSGQCHPKGAKSRIIGPPRQNNPHPSEVNFLLQDCKVLHEPICHVKTKVKISSEGDKHWWPSRISDEPRKVPKFSQNSTNRADYQTWNGAASAGRTRHGNNPHKMAATGIVPINHLPVQNGPRLIVERISYQHGYDSRKSPNQPQRGKLHGNFVWDIFHPVDSSSHTSSNNNHYSRPNTFPWEDNSRTTLSAPPSQAKMVQVSPTMAVLKPIDKSLQSVGHSTSTNVDSSTGAGTSKLSNIAS